MSNPDSYTEGLGEVVHAHRVYLGLSQRGMALRLGKDRRDYQRIETGRDACPPGMIDAVHAIVEQFDTEVDALIKAAPLNGERWDVKVSDDVRHEWHRNVVARACVESPNVRPVLIPASKSAVRDAQLSTLNGG